MIRVSRKNARLSTMRSPFVRSYGEGMSTLTSTPASVSTAPYHLTPEQIAHFDAHGYVVLPGRIPADLLARLQKAADEWIATGRALGPDSPEGPDYQWATRGGARRMFRVDYLHGKGSPASLELLGSPAVLGIAESLAGADLVPTYESLVFKDAGDGAAIDWHQDAVHPRTHRIFNVDVYLDASRAGEGALRVAPGSHLAPVDVCQLQDEYGWDAPGVVQVELEPGDVLVHDVMVVHGSEAVTGNRLRRFPEQEQFRWNASPQVRPEMSDDAEAELRIAHLVHSPGSYCSAGSVPFTADED